MKNLTILATTLLCSVVLSACGGGGSDVASVNPPTTPVTPTITAITPASPTPPRSIEGKMIIDNGRGTTNNQDTEVAK